MRRDPKVVDWNKVLHDAYDLGCKKVQFIGGEPMLHPKLIDYITRAHDLGYTFIEVYSNLTLMNDSIAKEFLRYDVKVATSFYSPKEDVHDKITGVKGSFRKTGNGIKAALNNDLELRVGIVKMDLNRNDAGGAIQFLVDLGVERCRIKVDHARPVGRGFELTEYESLEETLCGACWKGSLTISYDGSVYPCVFSREVNLGNLNDNKLSEIVASEKLKNFREFSYNSFLKKNSKCLPDWCNPDECDPYCNPQCSPPCSPDDCMPACPPSWP